MKKNILITLGIIVLSFLVYLFTMPKGIYTGDSGEIATAVYLWGIAHPTGFPLYLVLAKLFSLSLGWLTPAYALNIFSAVTSALTVGLVYVILRKLDFSKLISIGASLSLAFAYTFWSHATVVRTYSITALFFALAIFIFLKWINSRTPLNPPLEKGGEIIIPSLEREKRLLGFYNDKLLYLLALVCGLGLATHLTFVLIFPFILIFTLLKDKKLFTIKRILLFVLIFIVIAGAVYSYIPLRSSQNPGLNWGEPNTRQGFIDYITQKDYSEKIGNRSLESSKLFASEVGALFLGEFTWLGFLIILFGAVIVRRRNRALFYAGLVTIIFNILLLANYGNSDDIMILYRYFLPSYIIMSLFLAYGLQKLFKNKKYTIAVLLLPTLIFILHIGNLNRSGDELVPRTIDLIFDSVPENSILLTSGDSVTGPAMYTQKALDKRNNIVLIDDMLFTHRWYQKVKKIELENLGMEYSKNLKEILTNNKNIYSISNARPIIKSNFIATPHGLVYKISKNVIEIDEVKDMGDNFWKNDFSFLKNVIDAEYFNKELVSLYTTALNNYGTDLTNDGFIDRGIEMFKKSLEIRENQNALYNLAGIYNALGENKEALEYKERFDRF